MEIEFMDYSYDLNGATPVVRKYHASAAITRGTMAEASVAGEHGLTAPTSTTSAPNVVGLAMDTVTAPDGSNSTDGSDPSRFVSVIINPGAVVRARLSGGAAEGTELTVLTVVTADTLGDDVLAGTTLDESVVWGYSGANVGQYRRMTTTAGNVDVAFRHDIAVGDEFLQAPLWPMTEQLFPQLTTLLTEVDASAAVNATNDNYRVIDVDLRDKSDNGRTNSYVYLMPLNSFLTPTTTIA